MANEVRKVALEEFKTRWLPIRNTSAVFAGAIYGLLSQFQDHIDQLPGMSL
jgi:hypothetical protein